MSCIDRFLRSLFVGVAAISLLAAGAIGAEKLPPPPKFVPGSWTLVLLPDTQLYTEVYPGLFTMQTHWIVKNKDRYNIRYVIGLGDITNQDTRSFKLAPRGFFVVCVGQESER